ncbi:MAG: hypothetical protein HUJ73_02185, partial [Eubacterium sp.]|nr:hypothetical protein [Eubacterium sp.]
MPDILKKESISAEGNFPEQEILSSNDQKEENQGKPGASACIEESSSEEPKKEGGGMGKRILSAIRANKGACIAFLIVEIFLLAYLIGFFGFGAELTERYNRMKLGL